MKHLAAAFALLAAAVIVLASGALAAPAAPGAAHTAVAPHHPARLTTRSHGRTRGHGGRHARTRHQRRYHHTLKH